MNVSIDLRPLAAGESGGIIPFVEGLLAALFAADPGDEFTVFHSDKYRLPFAAPANVYQSEVISNPAAVDAALAQSGADVFLRAYATDEPFAFPSSREVTIIPDLLHLDHPEYFDPVVRERRDVAFARAVEEGGAVVVISCHAQARIHALYPGAKAATAVIRPAPPRISELLGEPLPSADAGRIPTGPFFLYPARGWPHKNHATLLRAWRMFHAAHPAFALVLTGTGGCVPELLAREGDRSVHDLGHVSCRLLAELFGRAAGLVFPSLYEGFGLPLLEAFSFGLPAACGSGASLPEVGGDAVLAVDASDPGALAGAMGRIATDPGLRAELATRGRARLAEYDAAASARQLLGVLRDVASRPVPMRQVTAGQRLLQDRIAKCEELAAGLAHENADAKRHLAYELLLAQAAPGPLVSVVVAMGDTRGDTARCVRAWTREQTLPRDRLEVIVVSDGKEPGELEHVRRELGLADRVVHLPTDSDSALWAEGARHSRGRWLYFAEAHSYGEPDCLGEMIRYLLAADVPAASSRSWGVGTALPAVLEEGLFERVSGERLAPGHWNKLFFRGCAIERATYLRLGGLRGEYGLFAEPLFAAELHRAGLRAGHARRSIVRHFNAASFRELEIHIRDYTTHECEFRLAHPAGAWKDYFGRPPEWEGGGRTDAALARVEARVRLKEILRGERSLGALAKWLPACVLGNRWWRWRSAVKLAMLRRRVERQSDDKSQLDAFAEWWHATAVRTRIDFLTTLGGQTRPTDLSGRVPVDELPAPWLVGFHPLERSAGSLFRWSEPLAHVKLPLPAGDQTVAFVTGKLRPPQSLEVFVNGRAVPVEDRTASEGVIRVTVREAHRRDGLQYLTLKCAPWSAPGDTRSLGLPLFGIHLAAAQHQRIAA